MHRWTATRHTAAATAVEPARRAPAPEEELGELLFGIVAAARRNGLDAERALRGANRRFQDTAARRRRRRSTASGDWKLSVT